MTLPSTLKTIESDMFEKCYDLKKVQLPDGLERIEKLCFYGHNITELTVPKSVSEIGDSAF